MYRSKLILLFLLFYITPAGAQTAGSLFSEVAQSRYWKLLLHYKSGRSESSGPEFFFSERGTFDPEAELTADIAAFQDPQAKGVGPIKQHPQCAFPERFRFIKSKFQMAFPKIQCKDFEEWKARFNPRAVTLVYAAPFLGSPASMFGHTFLRIDSNTNALLDYGISFEAATGPNPGMDYVVKGLLGFYPGMFNQQAYYLKVNNYINIDSRDLWEYEINLDATQLDHMLGHIWEMGITYFRYYFFNKNCSYQLLSLLEVANPELDLRNQFGPMAIPVDTIRAIARYPGAIRSVKFRPAILKVLNEEIENLNHEEESRFFALRDHLDNLTDHESAGVLDALLDWHKYKVMGAAKTVYDSEKNIELKLLAARAKAPLKDYTPLKLSSVHPEEGHPTTKLALKGISEGGMGVVGLQFRPAIHDLLDSDGGYLPFSTLVIAQTDLSYLIDAKKIRLDQFKFAEVENISPLTALIKDPSWVIGVRLFRPEDTFCLDCLGGQIYGGMGLSLGFFKNNLILYGFAKAFGDLSNGFNDKFHQSFRGAPGVELGLLGRITDKLKTQISLERLWYFPYAEDDRGEFYHGVGALSYSFLPFELRLSTDIYSWSFQYRVNGNIALGWYY